MHTDDLVLYEEEFRKIHAIVQELEAATGARLVALVDRCGQMIATAGSPDGAGSVVQEAIAVCDRTCKLVEASPPWIQFSPENGHRFALGLVADRTILVVSRPTCGGRELDSAMKQAVQRLTASFDEIVRKTRRREPDPDPDAPMGSLPPTDGGGHDMGGAAAELLDETAE